MTKRRIWLIGVAAAIGLLLAADVAASLLVRTRRVNRDLTARLEAAFGRPVEVGRYSFSLLEGPRLEADSVTVGEDPRFGHEYFLRAQSVAVTLRWLSLLRGRVEFGSFSLSHPNLNVVDVGGRWNLEDWLPPASPREAAGKGARSQTPRLYRIEVSGGRINFKRGVDKLPFALVDVSGSVDESAPGRWRLSLDAAPMRAAVNLQDAGTLHLSGEVGGTSVRLRPATLRLRWEDASLSDVLRLAFGNDYGVRGREDLSLSAGSRGGLWHFRLDASARGLHRWDFVAEPGNPSVNVRLAGAWSPGEGKLTLTAGQITAPATFVALSGGLDWPIAGERPAPAGAVPGPQLHLHLTTAGVGARDLLAWYRSFHAGISPRLRASGWIHGTLDLAGWPPRIRAADLASSGLRVEGGALKSPVRLASADFRLSGPAASLLFTGLDFGPGLGAFRIAGSAHNFGAWKYRLAATGSTANLGALSRAAETLGARLSGYWKDFGGSGKLQLHWTGALRPFRPALRATLDLHDTLWREPSLPARVLLADARVQIAGNRFRVDVRRATTLGAAWHGWLERRLPRGPWQFDLSADRLDVRSLVARLGPQPRHPSLLERIFGFGHAAGSQPLWLATLDAAGDVRVARLSVPPLALDAVTGRLVIHQGRLELSRARGRFYGGAADGLLVFSVRRRVPVWHLAAAMHDANLAEISRAIEGRESPDRFSGRVSGTVDATARGATAPSLLDSLAGQARLRVLGARDRRIDWLATLEAGHAVAGSSRFGNVAAQVRLTSGTVTFDSLTLSGARGRLEATGSLNLARGSALDVQARYVPASGATLRAPRTYAVTGTATKPAVTVHPPSAQPSAAPPH